MVESRQERSAGTGLRPIARSSAMSMTSRREAAIRTKERGLGVTLDQIVTSAAHKCTASDANGMDDTPHTRSPLRRAIPTGNTSEFLACKVDNCPNCHTWARACRPARFLRWPDVTKQLALRDITQVSALTANFAISVRRPQPVTTLPRPGGRLRRYHRPMEMSDLFGLSCS